MASKAEDKTGRQIQYVPLVELVGNPRNPKDHSDETISASITRFGYIEPIVRDERTGFIVSGHGRSEALRRAEKAGGAPPEGVMVGADGAWLAPVVTGWASGDDIEATAALIALNRTTELGGWVDDALLDSLDVLATVQDGLLGVGYDEDDIAALRSALEEDEDDTPDYTRSTEIPQYTPTMPDPPAPAELTDTSRAMEFVHRINEHPELEPEVRQFLMYGAHRHTVFNYAKIAEFYAHADPTVQELMEESALVIIDSEDAIRNGYVRMSQRMAEILTGDQEDDYEEPQSA